MTIQEIALIKKRAKLAWARHKATEKCQVAKASRILQQMKQLTIQIEGLKG